MPPARPLLDRLMDMSSKSKDGCLIFMGTWDGNGYGMIGYQRNTIRAHRGMWMCHNGDIPDGMKVLHKCDRPACINIDHLFLGTQTDNMQDMIAKGRRKPTSGKDNPRAYLSEKQVNEILDLLEEDQLTYKEIGDMYNVAQTTIGYIKRAGWKELKEARNVSP